MSSVVRPRSSNGYDCLKVESKDLSRSDSKFQTVKRNSSMTTFGTDGGLESSSRDRLTYITTCLLGHQVDAHLVDGSVYSGIFHTTNIEKFGVVLKMARLIKDGSGARKDVISEPPARTFVIQREDLLQVIAKGLPVTRDELTKELQHEKQQDLMTDSCISQARHFEGLRELERWVPDENDLAGPELENTFDAQRNRGWDQFKANAALFGVKSTFREELYTTELQRGPHMRELERKAELIAREIASEETHDLHLAEERGIQLEGALEMDEETQFSSVNRGLDDSGYHDAEDILMDSWNDETFGVVSSTVIGKPPADTNAGKTSDGSQVSSKYSSQGATRSPLPAMSRDSHSSCENSGIQPIPELHAEQSSVIDTNSVHDNQFSGHAGISCPKEDEDKQLMLDQSRASKDEGSTLSSLTESCDKIALSPNATAFDPSHSSSTNQDKASTSNETLEESIPPKPRGTTSSPVCSSSSASSASDRGGITSTSAGRGLSSSSSSGSLSSEKSTLNPYAKEFKLNPHAKSYIPSPTHLRPSSPAVDTPFYYHPNVPPMMHMPGMPVGMGQHVLFNPHGPPMPPPFFHPNGPQYGQQMLIGQPRPFQYMPPYPAEMPYRAREF